MKDLLFKVAECRTKSELVPELYEGIKIRSKEEALFESSIFVDAHLGNTGVEGDL